MKNSSRAWVFLKQITSVLSSLVKAKSLALKNKTSAFKSRLIILSFLKNKKIFFSSITHKLQALVATPGHDHHHKNMEAAGTHSEQYGDQSSCSKAIVLYRHAMANESQSQLPTRRCTELVKVGEEEEMSGYQYDDEKYPDLTHSLFDSDADDEEVGGSVIDLVRNCKEDGENFNLEDEIDHVADLFIKRFHKQMKMQKLDSFKRYQEMLDRSV